MIVRAAAAQFATGTHVGDNLTTCLRMIAGAMGEQPDLVVLPEFCNHLSVYDDADHCEAVAVTLDGAFVGALGEAAARHGIHLVATATVLRRPGRVTVTNLLFDPTGALLATADKSVLMGNENEFLSGADSPGPVTDTAIGRIGTYSCMEGVACDTPRSLAVRGAQILTNSLNSFALDEASLHVPVRAAENRVFVVAANKVGPLIPADRIAAFAESMALPQAAFDGAGESQIVAPDGSVLAKAPRFGEAVVAADMDLSQAQGPRPGRRPQLYAPLADPDSARARPQGAESITVATRPDASADLVVLAPGQHPGAAVAAACLVTSNGREALVATPDGEIGRQPETHRGADGPGLTTFDLPWGRLAVVVGADVDHPELFRLAAIAGCHVVAVTTTELAPWQIGLGLPERAAENRLCVVAAAPGIGLVVDLPPDLSLWKPDRERPYAGTINYPDVMQPTGNPAKIHPARSHQREISKGTNLVEGRPAHVLHPLTDQNPDPEGDAAI